MKSILVTVPLVLLAACQSPNVAQLPAEQCGASSRQSLVGTLVSNLDKSTLPEATRVIMPGMPVTRDYRPYRLNVYVGESGKIERVDCG